MNAQKEKKNNPSYERTYKCEMKRKQIVHLYGDVNVL